MSVYIYYNCLNLGKNTFYRLQETKCFKIKNKYIMKNKFYEATSRSDVLSGVVKSSKFKVRNIEDFNCREYFD